MKAEEIVYKKSLLDMQKVVLAAVSTDRVLFRKELVKTLAWTDGLDGLHAKELYLWLGDEYGYKYGGMIRDIFLEAGWRATT